MIQGLALALIGLIINPIWHQLQPTTAYLGYLAGLGFVGTGVFVQFTDLLLIIRRQRITGETKRSIHAGLPILVLFTFYICMELSASMWIQFSGNHDGLREFRLAHLNEKQHQFIPHPFLAYVRNPDPGRVNTYGFIGRDWSMDRKPGEIKIACIGGSTTADGYPEKLEEQLIRTFPDKWITVMNFGMSGWTSAHCLVNYMLNVRHFDPDYVVFHQGANDYKATWRSGYRTDYSHAFRSLENPSLPADWVLVRYMNSYAVLKWKYFEWKGWPAGPELSQLMMQDADPNRHVQEELLRITDIYSGNIHALVRFALDDGASVIMVTQPYSRANLNWGKSFIPYMERINAEILTCSAKFKVPRVDLDSRLNGKEEYFKDPLHLVDKAVALKAGKVAAVIRRLIPHDQK